MNRKVTEYTHNQKSPQKEILRGMRKVILKTFPGIKEEMRFGVPWYERYYLVALKDHVNVGVSVKGLSKEEMDLFEGEGKMMRHIKIFSLEEIGEKKVVKLLRLVLRSSEACNASS